MKELDIMFKSPRLLKDKGGLRDWGVMQAWKCRKKINWTGYDVAKLKH